MSCSGSLRIVRAACVAALFAGAAEAHGAGKRLLVTSFYSSRVVSFDIDSGARLGDTGAIPGFAAPLCSRVGPDGRLYVASEGTDRIFRFDAGTLSLIDTFIAPGSSILDEPAALAWDANGDLLVASFSRDLVQKFNGDTGAFLGTFVAANSGGLNGPDNGMTFGPDGHLYIPSYFTNSILKYDGGTGAFLGSFVTGVGRPRVLEFRGDSLYVTSETADAVLRYDAQTGEFLGNFTTPGAGGLDVPVGLAFADGFMFVTSIEGDSVLRFDAATGAFIDVFASGAAIGLNGPVFLTVIPAPGAAAIAPALLLAGLRRRR
ncbi:MAG: hypothetical protein IBJ10_01105 [Phycisphaerales bacterium]|nr:hypothetical protein [Phycisphaerales bacterium]